MDRYFVWNPNARRPVGPFEPELLHRMVAEGAIERRTLLVRDGGCEWSPACEIPELSSRLAPLARSNGFHVETSRRSAGASHSIGDFQTESPAPPPAPRSGPRPESRSLADDASFNLEILELNSGHRRSWIEYAVLTGALNAGILVGALNVEINVLSSTILLGVFVMGNSLLSWLFGVVMR